MPNKDTCGRCGDRSCDLCGHGAEELFCSCCAQYAHVGACQMADHDDEPQLEVCSPCGAEQGWWEGEEEQEARFEELWGPLPGGGPLT